MDPSQASAYDGEYAEDMKPTLVERDEVPKEEAKPQGKILVKVVYMGSEIQIQLKRSRPLQRIFDEAGRQFGFDPRTVRFSFDGERLKGEETLESVRMEDGDEIDVFPEQIGGWWRLW